YVASFRVACISSLKRLEYSAWLIKLVFHALLLYFTLLENSLCGLSNEDCKLLDFASPTITDFFARWVDNYAISGIIAHIFCSFTFLRR
ncbi:MAG: hypothetical protein COT39_03915, partial [Parcubacteria group bacterium CG08_land_8_20_14_0_20_48_21]